MDAVKLSIDLRGVLCPLNYVKAKAALHGLEKGEMLELLLSPGEPSENVPASLKKDGHRIIKKTLAGFTCTLLVEKR